MSEQNDVLLVGSVGLQDARSVFTTLADHLGERAHYYPDGETGERSYWIVWQMKVFSANRQLTTAEHDGEVRVGSFRIADGVDPADLEFGPLGYAEAAISSYKVFRELKEEGKIPASVRFQVAMPTPVAVMSGFVVAEDKAKVEPAYERAVIQEVQTILDAIPHDQLAIQWDVCYEILALDGGVPIYYDNVLEASVDRICRLGAMIPAAVDMGIHLCYGDPGHKHIQEPEDFGSSVAFANAICDGMQRQVDWMHMPAPKDRNDDAYYAPLKNLAMTTGTRLFLGLVHQTDGKEGTLKRIELAKKYTKDFGVATECGFGRRKADTIPGLLDIHVDVCSHLH